MTARHESASDARTSERRSPSWTTREPPREAWILAGTLDGKAVYPPLHEDVAGLPHVLRLAGEAAIAGVARVHVLWQGPEPAPDVAAAASDPRLASRATLDVVTEMPPGDPHDAILVVRGDRVFHRDVPKQAIAAWKTSTAPVAKVEGSEHDAVWVTDRAGAARFAALVHEPRGVSRELERPELAVAPSPYLGFTSATPDARGLARASRQLVWSLRKSADGIAAKLINRHLSLPITWLLRRTSVLPNHMTAVALLSAIIGAVVISRGGYVAGAVGMLLVNWGSIIDGVDGELARLKFQFSQAGQWFDTMADDVANLAYSTGVMMNLSKAGVAWATPLWAAATIAFLLTQSTQYYLIRVVYKSGDLAAIPWAFQSSDFLSQQPRGFWPIVKATLPKMLKRDFAVTIFTICGLAGVLEPVLLVYSTGALVFFCVFFTQFARNFSSLPRRSR